MLIIWILLTTLGPTMAAKIPEILAGDHREEEWNSEVIFWADTVCRAGRSRVVTLHEVKKTRSSTTQRLHDFFGDLMMFMQTKCGGTSVTAQSRGDHKRKKHQQHFVTLTKPPVVIDETNDSNVTGVEKKVQLFPRRDVEILLLQIDESFDIMESNVFKDWDNKRHVIVLMLTRGRMTSDGEASMINSFVFMLQRLWSSHRVLSVFFAAPFSPLAHLIWFYDPFVNNTDTGFRGRVYAQKVSKIARLKRVKNLQGYELNIGMFEERPVAVRYSPETAEYFPFQVKTKAFLGMDGLTMDAVATHMNFTFNIVPPSGHIEFGHASPNGTFVGTLGDVAYHRIDIGFNSMYMKLYASTALAQSAIEFTVPIVFDPLCVIVPRAEKIPRWQRTFHYFQPAIWGCLVFSQIIVAGAWYIIRNFRVSKMKEVYKDGALGYPSLFVKTLFLAIGAPVKLQASQVERIILTALLMFGVTIIGTFTGILYDSFTHEMYYKEINSLKELDQSGLQVGTGSRNLLDVFGHDPDDYPEIKSLRTKLKIREDGIPNIEKTARHRDIACLSRKNFFQVLSHRYSDESGESLIHLVPECRSYYLSYPMPKDSVYIDRVNVVLRRLVEAGLPTLWHSVTTNKLIIVESNSAGPQADETSLRPFDLRDMQSAFFMLLIGHALAACLVLGELFYARKRKLMRLCSEIFRAVRRYFRRVLLRVKRLGSK